MVKPLKFKEGKVEDQIQLLDSPRIILEKKAYDKAGVVYPDSFENQLERQFLYYKSLSPDTYYCWIDQVWRVLDERDGKEYIMYHAYHYVTQVIKTPDGKTIKKNHNIDLYEGFHHKPIVNVKEFNPDGSIANATIETLAKVYDIPWSLEAFNALLDAPSNKGQTNQFALGLAPVDGSSTVPVGSTTQQIRNRQDFSEHSFEKVMQLGRSQLSTSQPSMDHLQRILDLRQQLDTKSKPTPKVTPSSTTTTTTTTAASSSSSSNK